MLESCSVVRVAQHSPSISIRSTELRPGVDNLPVEWSDVRIRRAEVEQRLSALTGLRVDEIAGIPVAGLNAETACGTTRAPLGFSTAGIVWVKRDQP